ncbi:MAG: serine/threonine protein kinase [Actinomycetota bacterium]|nr:serine/threonine protein kinase [Actinomycetota bacterium]
MSDQEPAGSHRYRLLERIATGGMGEVWRGRDTRLHREVAVKLLKHEYAGDAGFRARFTAEARNAASLHHPGIASVFDYGEGDVGTAGRPYLVMELVPGRPLSALLSGGVPLPPEQARDVALQTATALAISHQAGIVHRDIKPGNLLLTPEGQVKITDFGIARAADALALTQTGEVLGTPQYLAPEQAEGLTATPASDVYALGAVLFTMLAGRPPFQAESPVATALAHLHQPVPELPDGVPGDLAAITRRALAKQPADRYADAGELAAALRQAAGAAPSATRVLPATTTGTTGASYAEERGRHRHGRRLPAWWPIAGVAAAAVVLIGAVALSNPGAASNQPTVKKTSTPGGTHASSNPSATPRSSAPPASTPSQTPNQSPGQTQPAGKAPKAHGKHDHKGHKGHQKKAPK